MNQVWFLFKILETIIGTACMIYHALGITDKESLPHIMLFCGTFFGFTLLAIMGTISIVVGNVPSPLIECILNFCAAVMYFMSSIISMYFAENDFHLMYLSDFEEPLHPYFDFCRSQSICALAAGAMHLLHAILAFDAVFSNRFNTMLMEESEMAGSDIDIFNVATFTKQPLRMYFLSSYIEFKLRKYAWFENLCERRNPSMSIFSTFPRYRGTERKTQLLKSMDKTKSRRNSDESDIDKPTPILVSSKKISIDASVPQANKTELSRKTDPELGSKSESISPKPLKPSEDTTSDYSSRSEVISVMAMPHKTEPHGSVNLTKEDPVDDKGRPEKSSLSQNRESEKYLKPPHVTIQVDADAPNNLQDSVANAIDDKETPETIETPGNIPDVTSSLYETGVESLHDESEEDEKNEKPRSSRKK